MSELGKLHWAIRLRKKLFVPWSSSWNAWVRDFTGWLEYRGKAAGK